jgi:TRAP-type mannitol/chloroaromatic compound transport system permease small subunit
MDLESFENKIKKLCTVFSYLIYVLVLIIVVQVILRYVFSQSMVALEELNWHLFAVLFLIGLTFSEVHHKHVSVDVLSSKFGSRVKGYVGLFGYVFLLMPFLYVVIYHGIPFVFDSYRTMEKSLSPSGLSYRFLIKSALPLSFVLLAFTSFLKICQFIKMIKGEHGS